MSCTKLSISQSLSFSIFQFFIFLHKSTNRWEAAASGAAHPAIWKQTASLWAPRESFCSNEKRGDDSSQETTCEALTGGECTIFFEENWSQRQRIDAAERGGHFAPPISRIRRVFRAICEFWGSCALENTAQPASW